MQTPFPGMDPWLEHPALWPDVHNSLIAALRDAIVPLVAPTYYVKLESRAYVVRPDSDAFLGRPDLAVAGPIGTVAAHTDVSTARDLVAILEVSLALPDELDHYYLEIRSVQTHQLITAIELLSPVNKVDPHGRADYLVKRYEMLLSRTNFIEIDLLRSGAPMPLEQQVTSDYRILVSRGWTRRKAHLYAFNLPASIPDIPLPLQQHEPEPSVPVNQIMHDLYTRARFDLQIDYAQDPVPALSSAYADWVAELIGRT